jgi:two-component system, cell cycle response regulator
MTHKNLILIIDDEPIIQHTLAALLDDDQFELAFAINGEEGLELAAELFPDVILLDIMLPGQDGFQVCRTLREHPQLADVPIIMLTALDDRDSKLAGLMAGADDFLTKPFDSLEMRIRLKTILRLNRFARLAAERARFAWIVEQTADGYLLLDAKGCIQFANARAKSFLHLPEAYHGTNFIYQVERAYQAQPADRWAFWSIAPSAMYFIEPETGISRPFWLLANAIDTPVGPAASRVVSLRDVTDEMSTYHDTRKFHSAITHKLRTPVSIIYGAFSLLEMKIDGASLEEIKSLVHTASKGIWRLLSQVRDVLNYLDAPLRLQVGAQASLGQLAELVQKTTTLLDIKAVNLTLPAELYGLTISLTLNALELILEELLENAKKFHPQQAPQVEIEVTQADEHHILIQIADDGLTLTAEQLSWAWLPYFQGEKVFTGEIPGMGLGFPAVATLVWQAGGKLRLSNRESVPGIVIEMTIPIMN